MSYIIRFQSALPVRQAVVREDQIHNEYDKMGPKEKESFDASWTPYINHTYDDEIVIHVTYGAAIVFRDGIRSMEFTDSFVWGWDEYPEDSPPTGAALITSAGLRVKPVKIIGLTGKKAFLLLFPRRVNGELVLSQNVKSVRIEIPHPGLKPDNREGVRVSGVVKQGMRKGLVSAKFDIEKMRMNGEALP